MSKENHLLPSGFKSRYTKSSYRFLSLIGFAACLCYTFSIFWPQCNELLSQAFLKHDHADTCPQTDVLFPHKKEALWTGLNQVYGTDEFIIKAADWLAGAVRVP